MRGLLVAPEDTPYGVGIRQIRDKLFAVTLCCTAQLDIDTNRACWVCGDCEKAVWFPLGRSPSTYPYLMLNKQHAWVPSDIFNLIETWTGLALGSYTVDINYGEDPPT